MKGPPQLAASFISPSPSFLYQLEKAKAALNNISSGVGM
jgi:hypothetical protein